MGEGPGGAPDVVVVEPMAAPAWLGQVVEQGIEAIVAFDSSLTMVYANQAACDLLGYRVGQLIGIDVLTLVHPDDLARAAANIVGIGRGAQPDAGLLRVRRGDGSWCYYELRPRQVDLPPPPDGPGTIAAVSIRDNTVEDAHWLFLAQVASGAEFDDCIATFTTGLSSLVDGPMAVAYEIDGSRRFSGALPPELTWPDPIPEGSPWHRALATAEPTFGLVGELPPVLRSEARSLGIEAVVVVPVADPAHREPAFIVQGPRDAAMGEIVMIALSRRPKDALTIAFERRHAIARLEEMAMTDPLTGLANRTSFFEALDDLAATGATYTVCSIDLDSFKEINDAHGHHVGDEVLVVCSRRLAKVARAGDVVARLGGDEFAVVHVGVGDEDAPLVARRMVEVLNRPARIGSMSFDLGASVGVATSRPGVCAEAVLADSDAALYAAKRAGRGTWRGVEAIADLQPVEPTSGRSSSGRPSR